MSLNRFCVIIVQNIQTGRSGKMEFDLKNFRLSKLNTPQYRHLYYLLYWAVYGFFFFFLEKLNRTSYTDMATVLDKYIPFCEYFIISYALWFVYMAFIIIYIFFFDIESFKKFSIFAMITYSVAVITYFVFPSMQSLRPAVFERDNIFVTAVKFLYTIDTPTNVCPSVHVIGSMAGLFAVLNSKKLGTAAGKIFFTAAAVIICASTMFLKQHAAVDVIAGLAVAFITYPFVYCRKKKNRE